MDNTEMWGLGYTEFDTKVWVQKYFRDGGIISFRNSSLTK